METSDVPRIPLQVSRNCVVASIQIDLSEEVLQQFRTDLLELLHTSGADGVILDVSGVDVLDVEDFQALKATTEMAALMGARTILSGLRPGVVSALVELDADIEGIEATLNLDEAFRAMEAIRPYGEQAEPAELNDRLEPDVDYNDEQDDPFADRF